jgi:hypothetical protein
MEEVLRWGLSTLGTGDDLEKIGRIESAMWDTLG